MQIRKYLNQTYGWRSAHWLACRTRQTFNERRMIEWLHERGTLFGVKFCCVGNDGTKRYSARAEKQRKIKWFRVIRIGRSHCHVKLSIRIIYSSQVCTLCECSCCEWEWAWAVGCVYVQLSLLTAVELHSQLQSRHLKILFECSINDNCLTWRTNSSRQAHKRPMHA